MNNPTLLLGAPGTGKTYRLVQEILKDRFKSFCFVSFTRRAANEAKERLKSHFPDSRLKYVRTIHSMCFELAGLHREQIMNNQQVYKFANEYGYDLHPQANRNYEDGTVHKFMSDDDIEYRRMMIDMARMNFTEAVNNPLCPSYMKFMKENELIDYHNMLQLGMKAIDKDPPKFDLLLVDEFQDLTPLQLEFIGALQYYSNAAIYAGDPNQMIFEWAGVDRNRFLKIANKCKLEILGHQFRLPMSIADLSAEIAHKQIEKMSSVSFNGIEERGKTVEYCHEDDIVLEKNQQYLVLARNNYLLDDFTNGMNLMDEEWSWLDDEIDTHIKVSTIHGAKGAEADNVVLFTDVSPATFEQLDSDAEHRVWYVAVTRAKKKLYIVQPQTEYFYDLE